MRDSTSANTKRAKQAQPLQPLEGTPFLEWAGGDGPGLIARDAALRGGALTGLLVDRNAAEQPVDVLAACGTVLSKDRLLRSHGPSGLAGRVPGSGHTAGEPIVDKVFTGAENALRVANLAGCGGAATAGDVAGGEGRGVAGLAR